MDEVLKRIKRQAGWAPNWFELAIGVMNLCDYIAELAAQLAALELRLAKLEQAETEAETQ